MGTSYPIISQHTKTCSYSRNFQSYKLRDTKLKVHKICRAIRRSSLKSTLSSLERILKIFIDRFGNRNVSEAIKTLYSSDVCKRDGYELLKELTAFSIRQHHSPMQSNIAIKL
mmetsp:Transcript_6729/g.22421  ORF Transcript_6729/g.22421 Transcript_6729/m.22421 type:complete len:113 (+) Transcript_6729:1108-1446(+)